MARGWPPGIRIERVLNPPEAFARVTYERAFPKHAGYRLHFEGWDTRCPRPRSVPGIPNPATSPAACPPSPPCGTGSHLPAGSPASPVAGAPPPGLRVRRDPPPAAILPGLCGKLANSGWRVLPSLGVRVFWFDAGNPGRASDVSAGEPKGHVHRETTCSCPRKRMNFLLLTPGSSRPASNCCRSGEMQRPVSLVAAAN